MQVITESVVPNLSIWAGVKIFFCIGLVVYLVFALVVVRQVQIMTQTLKVNFELPIKILALAHLLFALGILVFALIVL
jgi:hypothetical protein